MKTIPVHSTTHDLLVKRVEESREMNFDGEHRHNFFEMLCFTDVPSGSVHHIDFEECPVRTDCLYILKPGQAYSMELTGHKGFLLAARPEYFQNEGVIPGNWLGHVFPDSLSLPASEASAVKSIIVSLEREYAGQQRKDLLAAYMNSLLAYMEVLRRGSDASKGMTSRMHKLSELIDRNYTSEHDVSFYAAKLSLGKKRLNVLAVETFGQTVKQMLQQRTIVQAKRLISRGDITFKEAAAELGFRDASYFSRFFRQNTGMTPQEFRKSLRA